VTHPVKGEFVMPGFMVKMSGSNVPIKHAPLLGADNQAIYGDLLGLSEKELNELKEKKVI